MSRHNNNRMDSTIACLLLFAGLGSFGFTSIMNCLGLAYYGSAWSGLRAAYTAVIVVTSVGLFIITSIQGRKVSYASLLLLFFAGSISLGFLITSTYAYGASYYFSLFLSNAIPGLLAGMCISAKQYRAQAWKYVDILVVILSLSVAMYFFQSGSGSLDYGIDYQSASYMAAVAFGLNLSMLLNGSNRERFFLFKTPFWKVMAYCLCVYQAGAAFYTGGRGGVLLVLILSVVALIALFRRGMSVKMLIGIIAVLIGVFVIVEFVSSNSTQAGISRILSGYDNRSDAYSMIWNAILDKPFFGYGPYGYYSAIMIEYPHNIILDLLLSFGLAGVPFELLTIALLAHRLRGKLRKNVPSWIWVILLYVLVRLFFSSTFLSTSALWFVLGFLSSVENGDVQETGSSKSLGTRTGVGRA